MSRKYVVLGGIAGGILLILSPIIIWGLLSSGPSTSTKPASKKMVVWALYDSQSVYDPVFQAYTTKTGIGIEYHRYTDPSEYRNTLIEQIAAGKGPDVAVLPNEWILRDRNKFLSFPSGTNGVTPDTFRKNFVATASSDLIYKDSKGKEYIYGFPSSIDSLALYYNKKYFSDYVLSSNQPTNVWQSPDQNDLLHQIIKLTKPDLSLERFLISGIALGRTDNITHGLDAFLMLALQYNTQLYDTDLRTSNLVTQKPQPGLGTLPPFVEALKLFTSFSVPTYQQFSWNDLLTKREFDENELGSFASGKLAMFYGYANDYEKIKTSIKGKSQRNVPAIDANDIGVVPAPQIVAQNPGRSTYAQYSPWMIPATSKFSKEGWDLILALTDPAAQKTAFEKYKKITSLSSMIDQQSADPVYGVFATQASFARTLRLTDPGKIRTVFSNMIMSVINDGLDPNAAAIKASSQIQCLLDQLNNVAGRESVNCLEGK